MLFTTALLTAAMFDATTLESMTTNAVHIQAGDVSYTTYFDADGTYYTDNGITGTWEITDNQLCVERSTGEANCQPVPPGKVVGDSWSGENAAGVTVTVTIVER